MLCVCVCVCLATWWSCMAQAMWFHNSPLEIGHPKRKLVFQPSIFSCELLHPWKLTWHWNNPYMFNRKYIDSNGGCSSQSCSFSSGYVVSWRVNHHSTSPILWLGRCWIKFGTLSLRKMKQTPFSQTPGTPKYKIWNDFQTINRYSWGPGVCSFRGLLESFPLSKAYCLDHFFSGCKTVAKLKGFSAALGKATLWLIDRICGKQYLVGGFSPTHLKHKLYRQIG